MPDMEAFCPKEFPLCEDDLNSGIYLDALIDATARLDVYKSKLADSKLDSQWFLPTLQQKEALASSLLEGTQATLDGVLEDQVSPNEKDRDFIEVRNYIRASEFGLHYLKTNSFSVDFLKAVHKKLMQGRVRTNRKTIPGEFRTEQNYIGKGRAISYVPPVAESVDALMENLVKYMNAPTDNLRPLVRTAILHAQLETIHPFMDGNGRVGRILIPLYLYKQQQIPLPFFYVSEALERDKFKYYQLLNDIRLKNDWSSWIKFFLETVVQQCEKYIETVNQINALYERDLNQARELIKNSKVVDLLNLLYKFPIISTNIVVENTDISSATATRYLKILTDARILYTDGKSRNKLYFYYELLNVLR